LLAALALVAACGVAPPSPSIAPSVAPTPTPPPPQTPGPSPTPTPRPTPTPTPDPRQLGNDGSLELLVVHIVDGQPFFDVLVQAVTATGDTRTVGSISDVHPAAWPESRPIVGGQVSIGPEAHLLLQVERDGGGTEDSTATLVYDLSRPALEPVELPSAGGRREWGPHGLLAWVVEEQADGPFAATQWLMVATPNERLYGGDQVPDGVVARPLWTADGSGWLASRAGDLAPGVLREDLTFALGVVPPFEVTGTERLHSARGGSLASGISDGPAGPEYELQEYGLDTGGACRCIAWIPWTSAQQPVSSVWDASGTGVWIVSAAPDGARRWLEHRTEPGDAGRPLELPAGDWTIVGRADDDALLVLGATATRQLAVVDTAAWTLRVVANGRDGSGTGPIFAGWLGGT
jgi:hypothetical protein